MPSYRLVLVTLAVAAGVACSPHHGVTPNQDYGAMPDHDPYRTDHRGVTEGRLEYFRSVVVDPATFPDTLQPVAPPSGVSLPTDAPAPAPASTSGTATPAPAAPVAAPEPPARPTAPYVPAKGDLPIVNDTTAWADVKINGVLVGKVGPLCTAYVHDVKSGVYDLHFTLPTGFQFDRKAETTPSKSL